MTRHQLVDQIFKKGSYLCVGLDTDITKIPKHLLSSPDPIFQFNKQIINATKDLCVGYKINTAFYEANGVKGWESLEKTANYIPTEHFKIADAKIEIKSFLFLDSGSGTINFLRGRVVLSRYQEED